MPFPILLATSLLARQDIFKKTAEHQWAYQALALAERERIILGYVDDENRGRRLVQDRTSRYEVAVETYAAATNHLERAEAFLAHATSEVERASLLRSAVLLPFYKRAEREFKTELAALGVEGDFGQSRLTALTRQIEATVPARSRPFRDVPADHWAAKAVGDLRALGLLDGYPDARFGG